MNYVLYVHYIGLYDVRCVMLFCATGMCSVMCAYRMNKNTSSRLESVWLCRRVLPDSVLFKIINEGVRGNNV